jgi:HD-GYP domain-containing protein (c-di-GMP phosphodiesterase class II)
VTGAPTPLGGGGPSLKPTDLRFRQAGQILLNRFSALIRIGRAYQVGNQVFRTQISGFILGLDPVFVDRNEAILVCLEDDFYLNGVRIPLRSANLRFHQFVLHEFKRRRIAGLKFEAGLGVDEMEKFCEIFLQPDVYHGTSLLEATLAAGVDRITPVIHASTEAPSLDDEVVEDDEGEGDAWVVAEDFDLDGTGGSGPPGVQQEPGDRTPVVRKNFNSSVLSAKSLLTTTALHTGMQMRHAKRCVQPLVDGAFASEPVVVGLSTLGHHDEYTYAHSVNVVMVAVTMGHFLQMDRRALADLGVAALVHDVGKSNVNILVKHPLEEWDAEDRAAAELHPVEGAKILARSTALSSTTLRCMRVALEHHMNPDGTGYPLTVDPWEPSLLSRLVAVADCYVNLLMHRSETGRNVTPYDALGMMLGPLHTKFDPGLLWALVQTIGFFPPGQWVELSDGRIAVVTAPNPNDLERPSLRIAFGADGVPVESSTPIEYRPLPPDLSIRRALKAHEYPGAEDSAPA